MGILIRLAASALALWVATLVFDGITVGGGPAEKAGTLIVIAILFGVINAVLRPVAKLFTGCLYWLTLGLFALVVNGLLLLLTSWIAGEVGLAFNVDHFWPTAVLGALLIGVVSWLINFLVPDRKDRKPKRQNPPSRGPQPQRYR